MERKIIEVTGIRMKWEESGEGFPIIFLNGIPTSPGLWRHVVGAVQGPVVSFDVDGAREVVNENTGFLIEPENVPQLVEACEKLIADPDLRFSLGYHGRESVMEKFAPETMVATIESVYHHLIYGRAPQDPNAAPDAADIEEE